MKNAFFLGMSLAILAQSSAWAGDLVSENEIKVKTFFTTIGDQEK